MRREVDDQSMVDQSMTDHSMTDQSMTDQSMMDHSMTDQSMTDHFMTDQFMVEEVESKPFQIKISPPVSTATKSSMKPLRTRVVVVHNNMVSVPVECFQPPDSGSCSKDMVRVYYDHETRTCKPFSFTGCGGNANRFLSVKNCYRICHPYRYQVKPAVSNVKKTAILSAPRPIVLVERVAPSPRPQVRIIERRVPAIDRRVPVIDRRVPVMVEPPNPRMAMVPVSSYQSVPVESAPIMRRGYMAVNNYGGFTRGFGGSVKPWLETE